MGNSSGISEIWKGISAIGDEPSMILMWIIAIALFYVGIVRKKEPLLLIPISMGILLANMPLAVLTSSGGNGDPGGFLKLVNDVGLSTGILPLLIFLGLGAAVDFEPMLANPKTLLLGAGAQAGVFVALLCAILLGMLSAFNFNLTDAAAIGIIGGSDGPTTIFLGTRMHQFAQQYIGPNAVSIVGATAVATYAYMALVPIIQPPIIRLITTQSERRIRMSYPSKPVSKRTKILFPIITTIVVGVIAFDAIGLIGMLMLGNLIKESGVVPRLASGVDNLMNMVIVLLGLAVGATMPAAVFLKMETLAVFVLGFIALVTSTIAGVLLAKLMNLFSKTQINPMIGAAGVSAVPMSARVVQDMGRREDPHNFLLMHAMGPNVAGVIGTATSAGFLIAVIPTMLS
jgi:sodium ion-translocating decarboxylase beta subunit